MSTGETQGTPALGDYLDFLRALDAGGVGYAVIGGCAVGAYARLSGESVISADLDVCVPTAELEDLLVVASKVGAQVEKRPQPRSVPVAVLRWRGLEINAITSSLGLPAADKVIESAREFEVVPGFSVPVADAFDLLSNKLAVFRDKDRPHVDVLRRFLSEEVVVSFAEGDSTSPRKRIWLAKRFLAVNDWKTLPAEIFDRLARCSLDEVSRRFLVANAPDRQRAEAVCVGVTSADEAAQLAGMVATRFPPT